MSAARRGDSTRDYNIQITVGRAGGLIGAFGNDRKLVERARRQLNARGYRVVTWREDPGSCGSTLAALVIAPLTLLLWWPRPGLIVIGEPIPESSDSERAR